MKRVLTALVLVPVITCVVLWSPPIVFIGTLLAIGAFAFREFSTIAQAHGWPVNPWLGPVVGLVLLALPGDANTLLALILTGFASMVGGLRDQDLRQSLPSAGAFLLGVCYIFGSWRCAVELRDISTWLLMFALALNWVGDTAALYVGRAIGRHKLAPIVSPGKTWEGAIASTAASVIFGFVLFRYAGPLMPWWTILLLSVCGNVAGQFGDLVESAFKRGAGMKDSGTSLPGHGGWLDRIDSSLFTVPVVYTLTQLLGVR